MGFLSQTERIFKNPRSLPFPPFLPLPSPPDPIFPFFPYRFPLPFPICRSFLSIPPFKKNHGRMWLWKKKTSEIVTGKKLGKPAKHIIEAYVSKNVSHTFFDFFCWTPWFVPPASDSSLTFPTPVRFSRDCDFFCKCKILPRCFLLSLNFSMILSKCVRYYPLYRRVFHDLSADSQKK